MGLGEVSVASAAEMDIMYWRPSTSTLSAGSPLKKSVKKDFIMVYSSETGPSNGVPLNNNIGFNPTAHFLFLNWAKVLNVSGSRDNSSISRTLYPNVLVNVRECGLFFDEEPKTRIEASFFSEKNSREVASSKGWMGFFFVNFLARGMRSW